MVKKLYRKTDDKKISGVCSGIAEYTNTDVSIIRILFVILAFWSGIGLVVYICAALILPTKEEVMKEQQNNTFEGEYTEKNDSKSIFDE